MENNSPQNQSFVITAFAEKGRIPPSALRRPVVCRFQNGDLEWLLDDNAGAGYPTKEEARGALYRVASQVLKQDGCVEFASDEALRAAGVRDLSFFEGRGFYKPVSVIYSGRPYKCLYNETEDDFWGGGVFYEIKKASAVKP